MQAGLGSGVGGDRGAQVSQGHGEARGGSRGGAWRLGAERRWVDRIGHLS